MKMDSSKEMVVLKKSRKSPLVGDYFVYQLEGDSNFYWGRVIDTDAKIRAIKGAVLIYLYQVGTKDISDIPNLNVKDLLTPPIMTNEQAWKKGYFMVVAHSELESKDILDVHCFRGYMEKYYNEKNDSLLGPVEPVGEYGLHSVSTIIDAIFKARCSR